MLSECLSLEVFQNSEHRRDGLARFLRWYNQRRPHRDLGGSVRVLVSLSCRRRECDQPRERLHLEQCALIGHLTAAAWHNAQLYLQLEDRARTDSLTGLHNKRWLDEVAPLEAARSLRRGADIGLLLLDLDHFKLVNDTAGHAAGDQALKSLAHCVRSVVRAGDDVVRLGVKSF